MAGPVVLVVDDSPTIRKIVEITLKRQGMQVVSAPSGVIALAAIANTPPQLILLDIMLPKVNGYQICQIIRRNPVVSPHPGGHALRARMASSTRFAGNWWGHRVHHQAFRAARSCSASSGSTSRPKPRRLVSQRARGMVPSPERVEGEHSMSMMMRRGAAAGQGYDTGPLDATGDPRFPETAGCGGYVPGRAPRLRSRVDGDWPGSASAATSGFGRPPNVGAPDGLLLFYAGQPDRGALRRRGRRGGPRATPGRRRGGRHRSAPPMP